MCRCSVVCACVYGCVRCVGKSNTRFSGGMRGLVSALALLQALQECFSSARVCMIERGCVHLDFKMHSLCGLVSAATTCFSS